MKAETSGWLHTISPIRPDPRPDEFFAKVREMLNLTEGWHYGSGNAPTISATAAVVKLYADYLWTGLPAGLFPLEDGGLTIAFYCKDKTLEVQVSPKGAVVSLVVEVGRGFNFEVITDIDNPASSVIDEEVHKLVSGSWILYDSSTRSNSTINVNASQQRRFHRRPTDQGSQSSTWRALKAVVKPSAATSWHVILTT